MSRMSRAAFDGLVSDTSRALFVFAQWTILGVMVDSLMDGATAARKVAVVYLFISTWAINLYCSRARIWHWAARRGDEHTETIIGFLEIVTLMQAFGISWCMSRIFTLTGMMTYGQPFWEQSFGRSWATRYLR